MEIQLKKEKEIWILKIQGSLKAGKEFELADEIEYCLQEASAPKIILDLSDVPLMNSTTLGILLNYYREIEKRNGRLAITSPNEEIQKLLEITKASSLIEVFPTTEEALESFLD